MIAIFYWVGILSFRPLGNLVHTSSTPFQAVSVSGEKTVTVHLVCILVQPILNPPVIQLLVVLQNSSRWWGSSSLAFSQGSIS